MTLLGIRNQLTRPAFDITFTHLERDEMVKRWWLHKEVGCLKFIVQWGNPDMNPQIKQI